MSEEKNEVIINPSYEIKKNLVIYEDDLEKVYMVEYMTYSDVLNHRISHNGDESGFIYTDGEPFLIRESELDMYSKYGHGFRSLKYVGMITKKDIYHE